MFILTVNHQKQWIELKLTGPMTVREVDQLRIEIGREIARSGLVAGGFDALVDIGDLPVQPAAVHEALGVLAVDATILPRRSAIFGTSAARMHAAEPAACETRVFLTRWDAIHWLQESAACQAA